MPFAFPRSLLRLKPFQLYKRPAVLPFGTLHDTIPLCLIQRLRNSPQKFLRQSYRCVCAQSRLSFEDLIRNPSWQLISFPLEATVGQHHDPVVVFPTEHTTKALCCVTHSIERKEVRFFDAIGLAQKFETGFQNA